MSNIAGKSYAMNVITPIPPGSINPFFSHNVTANQLTFAAATLFPDRLKGLVTLSLIHYARWVIIDNFVQKFPRFDGQPEENLNYAYMMFFSNFNGSWDQYVDSFASTIPGGLDLLWKGNIRYPRSVPVAPFHDYIRYNQIETIHYYNAYPLATSNDIKSAKMLKDALIRFQQQPTDASDAAFMKRYNALLRALQHDLGDMRPTPIVSMSAYQVERRQERRQKWHDGSLTTDLPIMAKAATQGA